MARKILLADDSVTAQNMGRKILADAGYEVIAVNNGSAALKKIAELKPDLVILDVYMPGYSGLEVCQRLKESPETARIPVLLSVGKLEPFKPEEAQRVRADSYIVKPFEASELLSALSKLEDKVVPRAEPSKPGRFARAMAAAEETSRSSKKETASDPSGWSSRIGFPQEKTEPEEKVADDSAIYNPMNRDLRTVVETAAEKAAEKMEERQFSAAQTSEAGADVAALAPTGVSNDATPEELAAIAAAASQIQMAAAVENEHHESKDASRDAQIAEITGPASFAPPSDRVEDQVTPRLHEAAKADAPQNNDNKVDLAAAAASVTGFEPRVNSEGHAEETPDSPVTMAATAESAVDVNAAARWTAVPVALEGEEATVSLEQEMQKAYAAYAAYVGAEADSSGVATVPVAEAPIPDNPASLDVVSIVEAAPVEKSSSSEVVPVEADAVTAAAAEFAEPNAGFAPVAESAASAVETVVAEPAVAEPGGLVAPQAQEAEPEQAQPWPEAEPAMVEAATAASGDSAPVKHDQEHATEPQPDSETVKSTAAAWASWRQIRDTRQGGEVTPAQTKEFEVPESAPAETAAMAVAAGAEQILPQAPAAPSGDPADVASIVESVLANLRPKLMEEISRKMAEKK